VKDAADRIAELWSDSRRYDDLCRTAFHDAKVRLTWEAAGTHLAAMLSEMHPSRTMLQPRHPAHRPKVSVITVVRNNARNIERTIQAVLGQSYDNIEYIVVDGASTDGTVDVIEKYRDRISSLVSEPDEGIYDAMNKAVDLVSDPESYVIFANADDRLFSPHAIEAAVEKGRGADLIYGRMRLTDGEASAIMGRPIVANDLATETVCHPATLMKRRLFESVGKFDTSFRIAADYDLVVRCFQHPVSTRL
jgi:glycosyltransferase involved in cell wall biosynthesis